MAQMPYKHEGLDYLYAYDDHPFMMSARNIAEQSSCYKQRTGAVIVCYDEPGFEQGIVVGSGNNSVKVPQDSCPRQDMETGTGYHLCFEKCGGNLHAEVAAIEDMIERGFDAKDRDIMLYLYGHWYCCENCCDRMKEAGVKSIVLHNESGPDTRWF